MLNEFIVIGVTIIAAMFLGYHLKVRTIRKHSSVK